MCIPRLHPRSNPRHDRTRRYRGRLRPFPLDRESVVGWPFFGLLDSRPSRLLFAIIGLTTRAQIDLNVVVEESRSYGQLVS